MSFSGEVKEELSRQLSSARHCQVAELTGILSMCANVMISARETTQIRIETENLPLARKYTVLLGKAFRIRPEIVTRVGRNNLYAVVITDSGEAEKVLNQTIYSEKVLDRDCCKRAYLRGVFLAAGTMSNPEDSYHLEVVCASLERAQQIRDLAASYGIFAKISKRKNHQIVYVKEGASVVDMLGVIEAHVSLMNLENVRIVREMRGNVNRQVNCETANLQKTVSASYRQMEDIRLLDEAVGIRKLPAGLRELAQARLEHPEATLQELAELLSVGKSCVNHRFRKLAQMAESLKTLPEGGVDQPTEGNTK